MIIGVDLGGTKVRAALIDGGTIRNQKQELVKSKGSEEETIEQLIGLISSLIVPGVRGIGLGVPSVVDVEKGIVYDVVNIPAWKRVPLKDILEKAFSIPVAVNNDANCFALGEHRFGRLKGYRTAAGLTLGTGVGGGVIINHQLFTGNNCGAGEFGLLSYRDHNIEYYASGNFFDAVHHVPAVEAHDRALAGDSTAIAWWEEFGFHVGQAIKSVVYTIDPEAIVIGGSLSKAFPLFQASMRRSLEDFEYPGSIKRLKILQSVNEDITVLGAAALIDAQETPSFH